MLCNEVKTHELQVKTLNFALPVLRGNTFIHIDLSVCLSCAGSNFDRLDL